MKTDLRQRAAAVLAAVPLVVFASSCATQTERRSIAATPVQGGTGFVPERIVVQKENRVILRVGNGTSIPHGFSIVGYRIEEIVQPNETIEVRFRASRAGTFRIFCQLHPAHQTATLVVE